MRFGYVEPILECFGWNRRKFSKLFQRTVFKALQLCTSVSGCDANMEKGHEALKHWNIAESCVCSILVGALKLRIVFSVKSVVIYDTSMLAAGFLIIRGNIGSSTS